ncbi:MAG: hypothetical protein J3R72DRAFT_525897 [Linnemannia gamsii]|nr:MAG: hypothetical protein J3R72DRAFT_525897 [Linnemannia gamsii]
MEQQLLPLMSESRSPFDITEIVERIFSHVDDLSLRKTVPFVCRQWCLMIKEKPLRGGKKAADKAWKQLLLAMETYPKRYYEGFQQQRDYFGRPISTNCRLFYMPLREVDLRIDFIEDDQLDYIDFPSSLTSLKLNTTNKTLDLRRILFRCPLLEVFHVGQVGELRITGPIYLSDHDRRKPRVLRSLVLRGVVYKQSCLESLLSVTPRLQELKLIGLQSRSRSPRDRFEAMGMDSSRIYAIIQQLGLPIDSLHFSVTDCAAYATELRHKLYLYPRRPTEWSFWAQELEPHFMKELAMNTNNVTTLDVFWERINSAESQGRQCCDSFGSHGSAPSLRIYRLGLLCHVYEIGRARKDGGSTWDLGVSRAAASQHLGTQSSSFRVNLPSALEDYLWAHKIADAESNRTRDHWEKSFGSRRDALSWIHSSGHDAKSRAKRQGVVAGWERGIETERLTELERASCIAGSEEEMYWIPSVSGTLESGLTKHLEKLGLLSDVKDMMDEMDVDGYCCLPVLKLVSFGGEVAQAPEDALGLLDPYDQLTGNSQSHALGQQPTVERGLEH